ncbi:Panacea domain-containing protein [Fusobacterium varium]
MKNLDKICALIYLIKPEVTNLVLQKLLYFIQAYSLVETDEKAFDETIEAWMYGPVVPEVYSNLKKNPDYYKKVVKKEEFEDELYDITKEVVDELGDISPYTLVNLTHSYSPWIEAWNEGGRNTALEPSDIRKYHLEKFQRTGSIV